MKKQTLSYEEAMARLEELVRKIESNDTGIDQLAALVKEAQQLAAFCREKLYDFQAQKRGQQACPGKDECYRRIRLS